MKPFNLEEAKAGKPVCTRDGRDVRIVCFDVKSKFPIIAIISNEDNSENVYTYTIEGSMFPLNKKYSENLFMKTETKKAWINLYKNIVTHVTNFGKVYFSQDQNFDLSPNMIILKTFELEWEE